MEGSNKNLLSIGLVDDLGCKVKNENGIIKIIWGTLVLMKAQKIAINLYTLMGETLQEGEACISSNGLSEKSMMVWHYKLGYMSE